MLVINTFSSHWGTFSECILWYIFHISTLHKISVATSVGVTRANRENFVFLTCWQDRCCGVNGPSDWQKYTSAFRTENNDADYPWPRQCCVMNKLKEPLNLEACKLGVPGYYHSQVSPFPQGLPEVPSVLHEKHTG